MENLRAHGRQTEEGNITSNNSSRSRQFVCNTITLFQTSSELEMILMYFKLSDDGKPDRLVPTAVVRNILPSVS